MKYLRIFIFNFLLVAAVLFSVKPVLAVTTCGVGTCKDNFICQPATFCCPNLPKPTTTCGTNCCETINCFTYNNGITDVATCYPSSNINIEAVTKGATKIVCYKMICSNGAGSYKPVVASAAAVTCADPGYTVDFGWDAATDSCRLAPIASLKLSVDPDPAVGGVPPLGGVSSDYNVDARPLGLNIRFQSIGGVTSFIVKTMVGVAGVAFLIMFLIGAFKFVTSQGDKVAVESAKGTMTGAFIGIALAAALFAIMTLLQNVFGVSLLNITV